MQNRLIALYASVALFTGLIIALCVTYSAYLDIKADRNRLRQNQNILLHNGLVEISQTATGNSMASVPAVTLKSSEFRQSGDTLNKIAKAIGIKPSRITHAAQASTLTKIDIIAPLTYISDTTPATPKPIAEDVERLPAKRRLHYVDPWITLSGSISDSLFTGTIRSRDTLDIIIHRVPKHFLFFRFGCKAVQMNIVSRNKHTTLTYAKYYQLVK